MFDVEMALLHHRMEGIERSVKNVDFSNSPILGAYFQLVLSDIRQEFSELSYDMIQEGLMAEAPSTIKARYFQALSIKIANLRILMSAIDRDLPISKLVLSQSNLPEYRRLDRMVKECLGDCNPCWILCIWDELKCLLPRPSLRSPLPVFTFIIHPESVVGTSLLYPLLFHEVGHSALSTSSSNTSFVNLGRALDRIDDEYIFRTSSAGGGSKKKLINEWNMKRYWDMWGRELFCDYYAVLATGPAYLHAMVNYLSGTYPFDVSPTHPPIQLRLDFARLMSEKLGITDTGFDKNRERWNELKAACSFQETPKFRTVNDPSFVDALVNDVLVIAQDLGIDKRNYWTLGNRDSTAIGLINVAWEKVLEDKLEVTVANEWALSRIDSL